MNFNTTYVSLKAYSKSTTDGTPSYLANTLLNNHIDPFLVVV
jgi:hypothetical protein